MASADHTARFGVFELDIRSGELRKSGAKIRLQEQPLQILTLLLERPGEIVTRDEICKKLWPDGTFVDFERSVNAAIVRLREALDDSADNPRFVETIPRRGYRFIAPVQGPAEDKAAAGDARVATAVHAESLRRRKRWYVAVAALLLLLALPIAFNVNGLRQRLFGPTTPKIESIAVLPLKNLSGDPQQEYFADGMTEALITHLGKLQTLRVVSRTSVMQYRSVRRPLREIARELGVDAIIEGGVQRTADQARITVRLMDPVTERQLWAEAYQRELTDVFGLQSEVVQAIAHEVHAVFSPQEQARLARSRPIKPEAHEAFLRSLWASTSQEAVTFLQQAISMDPEYALAYAHLARTYLWMGNRGLLRPVESYAKAKAAAAHALALDDSLPEAHVAAGTVNHKYEWDQQSAERHYRRAVELNPSNEDARSSYAFFLCMMGRHDAAMEEIQRALKLDPVSTATRVNQGILLQMARRYDDAIAVYRKELEVYPESDIRFQLALTYIHKGLYPEAIRELRILKANFPDRMEHDAFIAVAYAEAGQVQEARKILRWLLRLREKRFVRAGIPAVIYAALGEKELAIEWLRRSFEEGDDWLIWSKVVPTMDRLRDDPRFQDLLHRIGLQP